MPKLKEKEIKKKELAESEDYLDQIDKGGRKTFIQYEDEKVKGKKRLKDNLATDLQLKKDRRFTYQEKIAEYGMGKLREIDFPPDWEYIALPTSDKGIRCYGRWISSQFGVVVILKAPDGEVYARGIAPLSFEPYVDMKGMETLAEQAENTVDSAKGILLSDKKRDDLTGMRKTKGGILLPHG